LSSSWADGRREKRHSCSPPEIGSTRKYTSLDDLANLDLAVRDPSALLMGVELITIDEIQRAPNLLSAIKLEVDWKRTPGRFLCTGSTNLLLMRQVSESPAGRAVYLETLPFTWSEFERVPLGSALDAAVSAESAADLLTRLGPVQRHRVQHSLTEAVFRGGFPVIALTENASTRARWFEGYIAKYIERDLRLLSAICRKVASAPEGGEVEVWGDGTAMRAYISIDDLVDGIVLLMRSNLENGVNIGRREYVSVDELVHTVASVAGKRVSIKHIEGPLVFRRVTSRRDRVTSIGWASTNLQVDQLSGGADKRHAANQAEQHGLIASTGGEGLRIVPAQRLGKEPLVAEMVPWFERVFKFDLP